MAIFVILLLTIALSVSGKIYTKMSILINDGNIEEDNLVKCDIGEFVISVKKLKKFCEPILKVSQYGKSVLQ